MNEDINYLNKLRDVYLKSRVGSMPYIALDNFNYLAPLIVFNGE